MKLRLHLAVPVVVLVLATSSRVRADDRDQRDGVVEATLGANGMVTSTESCYVDGGDQVNCRSGLAFGGLTVGSRWRPDRLYALGLHALVDFGGNPQGRTSGDRVVEDRDHRLWGLLLDARLYPARTELWLAAQSGLWIYSDSVTEYDASGNETLSATVRQVAPVVGVALGVDLLTTTWLLLGLDARLFVAFFGDELVHLTELDTSNQLGTSVWVNIGFNVTFRSHY